MRALLIIAGSILIGAGVLTKSKKAGKVSETGTNSDLGNIPKSDDAPEINLPKKQENGELKNE